MTTKIVQSISGGMDSTCLALHHLARGSELLLLSFDYGQSHRLELERLDANLALFAYHGLRIRHERISVPFGGLAASALTSDIAMPEGHYAQENMKQTVVPNRNAIFSAIAFAAALSWANESKEDVGLSLGVHTGDHAIYPDCREEFFLRLHEAFVLGNWNGDAVKLSIPFISLDKAEILRGALSDCVTLGLDFDAVLANTNTSYAPTPDGQASGKTGSDVERILAFHAIGRRDPVGYAEGWEAALAYALEQEVAAA